MARLLLILTPKARQDLDSIWTFSQDRWGAAQAETYVRLIAGALDCLARGTVVGRDASAVKAGYLRHAVGSHVVFFRLAGKETLEVVRILHQRMDLPRHL